MRKNLLLHMLAVVFCSIFFLSAAQAQYRASIQGTVTDQQGALVPDAAVTLTNQETSRNLQTTTNASGVFNFVELAPSGYTITVDKGGFKKYIATDVQIIAEQSNSYNVHLDVGATTDTVNVNGNDVP